MMPWIETYRGAASPWECDVTEHFTLAFYFDRIAVAEANLAGELGLLDTLRVGGFTRRYDVRLARELRAGSAFHIESSALPGNGNLRLGHRVVNSATGEPTTWFDVHWDGVEPSLPAGELSDWDGPEFAARSEPGDLDEFGRMGLCGMVHKFSDAAVQFGAAIGLTADYIKTARRSFSAFELRLRIARSLRLGEAYRIDTGLAHLGSS